MKEMKETHLWRKQEARLINRVKTVYLTKSKLYVYYDVTKSRGILKIELSVQ